MEEAQKKARARDLQGRVGGALALAAFVAGVVLRALYVFRWHPMMEHIVSDMDLYFRFAKEWVDPAHVGGINDTLFPPGTSFFFGALYRVDPSMKLAMGAQLVIASAIPVVLWAIGRELYGRAVGLAVLGMASLYFPLFEYAGFLLSENPFTLLLLSSFFFLSRAIRRQGRPQVAYALAAGAVLGLAMAFKTVALSAGVLAAIVLLWRTRKGEIRAGRAVAAAAVGLALVLTPLAVRATRLNEGRFCLVANEMSRGFLLGHHGDVFITKFDDRKRHYVYEFGYPTAKQKGRSGVVSLEVGPWDNREVTKVAWEWMRAHPAEAARLSFEHVYDLFAALEWPSFDEDALVPWLRWFQRGFLVFVVLPVAIYIATRGRAMLMREPGYADDLLLLAPIAGLLASAFVAVGEPRYRIPFDGFFLLLAARWYCEPPRKRISSAKSPQMIQRQLSKADRGTAARVSTGEKPPRGTVHDLIRSSARASDAERARSR